MLTLVAAELVAAAAGLGDTVNSIVEWYRPGSSTSPSALADGVCAIAFDGLRVRK
jgi:hypothetical protein